MTDGETKTQVDSSIIVTHPKKRALSPFFETQYLFSVPEVSMTIVWGSMCRISDFYMIMFQNAVKNTTVGFVIAKERSSSNLPVRFELRVSQKQCSLISDTRSNLTTFAQGTEKFTIRYVFGPRGASKAEIILLQELDFEKQNLYSITVIAIVS